MTENNVSAKERLVKATRDLLWERGYEATSPRHILAKSGAGQGSLYHHFSGKAAMAGAALAEVEREMQARAEAVLRSGKPPLERIEAYMHLPREALKGCPMGRLASEPAAVEHGEIRDPLHRYFAYIQRELAAALRELQLAERLKQDINVEELAATLFSAVQGGYIIARVASDPEQMERAIRGAVALLRAAIKQ